jgi:indole-3-glycerol phosphate synthase
MIDRLTPILQQKQREVANLHQRLQEQRDHPIVQVLVGNLPPKPSIPFKQALKSSSLAVIAEIKRRSPSKGQLAPISDPAHLAERYILGGANALSILTDEVFFNGHIDDLIQVRETPLGQLTPIIRKDFMIDTLQIAEAKVAGASAILCIISVLGEKKTRALLDFASSIDMDVLVEIHTHDELKIALDCGADMIGVNNRDLRTFSVDTQHALNMAGALPDSVIKVAESGITDPFLARQYYEAGFDAVLIGEALVTSSDPEQFIRACRYDASH